MHPAAFFVFAAVCMLIQPLPAAAYVGPGSGLAAVGSMLALLAAVVLALIGFVWYPLKRLIGKLKDRRRTRAATLADEAEKTDTARPSLLRKIPLFLFVLTITLAAFVYGNLVEKYRIFPWSIIANGVKTAQALLWAFKEDGIGQFDRFSEVPLAQTADHRIEFLQDDKLNDRILWYGGIHQFLDLCPGDGCLAVAYTTTGKVAHVWPLRLHELEQAVIAASNDDFPYEMSPAYSFATDVQVLGIAQYPNGDLLVIFHIWDAFPYSGGVARIDRDGYPLWFRRDYSHHWPHMLDNGIALVPGMLLGDESLSFESGEGKVVLDCPRGKPYIDTMNFIDGDGHLLKRINLLDAFIKSHYVQVLRYSMFGPNMPCDPLHLNFIHRIGDDVGTAWGVEPGDLVVSMRDLSAFAILDGASSRIRRLVRGSFARQHSVHHFEGTNFLMFDNHGSDGTNGPSRLLMIDIADGRETTIFPNDKTPEALRDLFTDVHGKMDISPDRRRVMVVFGDTGIAVEVRLSDGAALNVFTSLHDVSSLDRFSDERHTSAAVFQLRGLDYIRPPK